ncbi:uncharacterized protein TNCV_2279511 [Trichonephila clavipes]|uniref:Uncharacterized protein n=1 Tax=Trichonephila clavipes TaxID=2585209 RepID=A0A8X6UUS3_TRICX|nr:uncharacterized protein TNCV_2279511 [Trichonephila clavipes]
MSSVGYSTSPVHWSRWSPSILAWPQIGQASSAARSSQWRYTLKKSSPVVRRKWATALSLTMCLRIGPTVASIPWLSKALGFLGHDSIFVNKCGNNDLCSSDGEGDFRLRRLGSLDGLFICSLIAGIPTGLVTLCKATVQPYEISSAILVWR